jgi:hypothetical protein
VLRSNVALLSEILMKHLPEQHEPSDQPAVLPMKVG